MELVPVVAVVVAVAGVEMIVAVSGVMHLVCGALWMEVAGLQVLEEIV